MAKYYLFLYNTNDSNSNYPYELKLRKEDENSPEAYFGIKSNAEKIRQDLQFQTSSRITDSQLREILKIWIDDIQQGYRETTLHLELIARQDTEVDNVDELGNQAIPTLLDPDLNEMPPCIGALPPLTF